MLYRLSTIILTILLVNTLNTAQVYKLSEENPYNIAPKLIKDNSGLLYCFWLTDTSHSICDLCVDTTINNFTLCYRTFKSDIWSSLVIAWKL